MASFYDDASSITDTSITFTNGDLDDERGFVASTDILVGRGHEIEQLMAAYQRVLESHRAEAIFIHGASGSGKTCIVEKLREKVMETRGYFTTGKYFQNPGVQEPFYAIMAAFSDLCDIVTQSSDLTEERRLEIQKVLGTDGKLLSKSISNLSGFVVDDDDDGETESIRDEFAYARFKVACKTFLQAMASEDYPVALFIDDIQWMDADTSMLIRMLLRDPELKHVILVFAYREEESEGVQDILTEEPLMQTLDIHLRNLCRDDMLQMISTIMGTTAITSDMVKLSRLVESKTSGNPFHIVQFMATIQDEHMLTYNVDTSSWEFDVDQIQQEIMVSESVADLLQIKIRRLAQEVQDTLKIASMMGYRFSPNVVVDVFIQLYHNVRDSGGASEPLASRDWTQQAKEEVWSLIGIAEKDGFIEKTKYGYQFSHDKLQVAFQSEVPLQDQEDYHLRIGETFLEYENSGREGFDNACSAAAHLNLAPAFVFNEARQLRLVAINLKAAHICKGKSAFVTAAEMLRQGLALVPPEDKWGRHFDLTYELTESLARMEFILGNLEKCKEITKETLARGRSTEMMINSYVIDVEVRMAANEMHGATVAARRALLALGINMPRKPRLPHVVMKLLKVRRMIRNKTDEDILSMQRMTGDSASTATKVLLHVFSYLMLQDEDTQGVYYALMGVELTFKHGLSPYSACAFTCYGMVELSLDNHDRAYRFGKLSMRLLDKIKCNGAECPTAGLTLTLLTHWKDPIADSPQRLLDAVEKGFGAGDVIYGTYCLAMIYGIYDLIGRNLEDLERFMRITYQQIQDLSQSSVSMWAQPGFQYVLNLRTSGASWAEITNLDGEVMSEGEYMKTASEANHPVLVVVAWTWKAQISCLFRQYEKSISVYNDMRSMGPAFRMSFGIVSESFFAALACFGKYRESGRHRFRRMARRYNKELLGVAKHGCPTPVPHIAFLHAEELSVRKGVDVAVVTAAYEHAIVAMGKVGFVHLEALGHEQLGFYLASCGHEVDAAKHIGLALDLWLNGWGAIAKYEWLEERRASMFLNGEDDGCDGPGVRVGDVICLS